MKKLLIIGISGTLGNALIEKFYGKVEIIGFSRDENKQWATKLKYPNITFVLGDIRSYESIFKCISIYSPDTIISCAALKHIDICEYNIFETIQTNVIGTKNIVDAIINYNSTHNNSKDEGKVERFLFISTDKGCSPINTYGLCKGLSERLVTEASLKYKDCKFLCVRYGNVLNSRGSLIPKFIEMAKNDDYKYFPITSEDMTRFFMTIDQSVKLIENTLNNGISGDIWIPKIPAFKILELGKYFSNKYGKPTKIVGIRSGEKMHESLINEFEMKRTDVIKVENVDYYVLKPCYTNYNFTNIVKPYTSEETSDIKELEGLIIPLLNV